MEKTFAHQWYEVIQDMPFIAEFKSRWPALLVEDEASPDFEFPKNVVLDSYSE